MSDRELQDLRRRVALDEGGEKAWIGGSAARRELVRALLRRGESAEARSFVHLDVRVTDRIDRPSVRAAPWTVGPRIVRNAAAKFPCSAVARAIEDIGIDHTWWTLAVLTYASVGEQQLQGLPLRADFRFSTDIRTVLSNQPFVVFDRCAGVGRFEDENKSKILTKSGDVFSVMWDVFSQVARVGGLAVRITPFVEQAFTDQELLDALRESEH